MTSDTLEPMKYEEIPVLTRTEIDNYTVDIDSRKRSLAPLSASLYQDDWQYAQSICIRSLSDGDYFVVRSGMFGLSHIVRIHGKIDMKAIEKALDRLISIHEFDYNIKELIEDIKIYQKNSDLIRDVLLTSIPYYRSKSGYSPPESAYLLTDSKEPDINRNSLIRASISVSTNSAPYKPPNSPSTGTPLHTPRVSAPSWTTSWSTATSGFGSRIRVQRSGIVFRPRSDIRCHTTHPAQHACS
jgi:hypothetical protein